MHRQDLVTQAQGCGVHEGPTATVGRDGQPSPPNIIGTHSSTALGKWGTNHTK